MLLLTRTPPASWRAEGRGSGVTNLTIGRRIGVGFLLVVLSMVAVVVVGIVQVDRIDDELSTINDQNAVKQRYAINFRGSVHDRAIALRDVVLATTDPGVRVEVELIEKLAADYAASEAPMDEIFADGTAVTVEEKQALADIKAVQEKALPLAEKVIDLARAGDQAGAQAMLTMQATSVFTEWLRVINVLIDLEESMNQEVTVSARSTADRFVLYIGALAVLAALLALVIGWRTSRSITRPLAETQDVLAAVAEGDLTRRIEARGRNEVRHGPPARAQRHHRGRPGGGGRQGVRGGGQRGQGARAGDRPGHRGHRPPGAGDPGRHRGCGRRDRPDLLDHHLHQRPPPRARRGLRRPAHAGGRLPGLTAGQGPR